MYIVLPDGSKIECNSVISVPDIAISEPGYIRMFSENSDAANKHQFHALAQMAYFQYQDDEIEVKDLKSQIRIVTNNEEEKLESGLAIIRRKDGSIEIARCGGVAVKKMLEAVNRYCTRWVRLDI